MREQRYTDTTENLKNPNYVQLIFGDETKIAEKFAKVDKKIITEMKNNLQTKQKIYSSNKIKKLSAIQTLRSCW